MAIPTETKLWIDNDEPLYNRKLYMHCNLYLKWVKKTYVSSLAKKMFRHLIDEAKINYKARTGETLSLDDRRKAEGEFVKEFEGIMKNKTERNYLKQHCAKVRRERIFR